MLSGILNWIRMNDSIVKPSHTLLSYEGDVKQKTLFGGILSFAISIYVTSIAIQQGVRMVGLGRPVIDTREVANENFSKIIKTDDVPKLLISVQTMEEGWHKDPS